MIWIFSSFVLGVLIGILITIYSNIGFFDNLIQNMKEKFEQKRLENGMKKELERQARTEALKNLQGERIKHFYGKEKDKMTGKARQDKMDKFKNAFNMQEMDNNNFDNKMDMMLGTKPNNTQTQAKLNKTKSNSRENNKQDQKDTEQKNTENKDYFGKIDFDKKIDDMIGFKKK